jgi:hypothetical protein
MAAAPIEPDAYGATQDAVRRSEVQAVLDAGRAPTAIAPAQQPPPGGDPNVAMPPPGAMPPGAMPPGQPHMHGYPVMAGGRPFSSDLAPSDLRPSQRHFDPQHAANMMSPVGDHYPQMDWTSAAARPARAMPPWQLAVLFVGVVGAALLVTIIIAKLIH